MTEKWSPMIVHVARSYVVCPNCKEETHVGAPPNLWEMRQSSFLSCDQCKQSFNLAKRVVFKDVSEFFGSREDEGS